MANVVPIERFPDSPTKERGNEAVSHERQFREVPLTHLIAEGYTGVVPVLPPALPEEVLLGSLRDGRLRVQTPIVVKCSKENEHFVAEAVEFDEFGFGKSLSEALKDLQGAIVELYFALEREADRLGPDLQRVWEKLQGKILRRP